MAFLKPLALLTLAGTILASPCPYGQLAERGELSETEAANFYSARSDGETFTEAQLKSRDLHTRKEHAAQRDFYKRQLAARALPLGGGLLDGVLQPFTGALENLDVPTPQPTGLAIVPDDNHPYVAPSAGFVRGMCPTLNTMANHGYINRNGITTFAQAADACQITLGFGYDTCIFLSAVGLLSGGDLPSGMYSIGGADARVPNTLGPSLGISHHGFFEIDNSISREDAFFGNQANFNLTRFEAVVETTKAFGGEFGNSAFAQERVDKYNEAKNNNPEFDAGVRWLAVSTAERVFIFRAMPNGTHETLADYQNIAPFFMNETFPENWFRRANAYSLMDTGADIANLILSSPSVTVPGQNQGYDNFVASGIDLASVTPETATCFLATAVFDETPGFLSPALADNFDIASAFMQGAIAPFFAQSNCDLSQYGAPGKDATSTVNGPSTTCNILVNGKYQC